MWFFAWTRSSGPFSHRTGIYNKASQAKQTFCFYHYLISYNVLHNFTTFDAYAILEMTAYQRKFVKFKFTFCTSVNVQRSKSSRSDCQVRARKVNGKWVPALMLSESNCVSGIQDLRSPICVSIISYVSSSFWAWYSRQPQETEAFYCSKSVQHLHQHKYTIFLFSH